ncbi:hypothetical protein DSO57_1029238 [Entomophthora muscae]|uniref:Uncharacterized protein n=1 Tax=Entomophthora muscae TaxID=34485 RepID=A0ACC2RFY3_9FUNG|nr:hypothetical protein DSO57_1029238 [Entomophthora muscae]
MLFLFLVPKLLLKLGFAYIILLGFTEQVIPHMGSWKPWVSAVNYMLRIAPVVYWVFQAFPLSLFEDEPDTTPDHVRNLLMIDPHNNLITPAHMPEVYNQSIVECY